MSSFREHVDTSRVQVSFHVISVGLSVELNKDACVLTGLSGAHWETLPAGSTRWVVQTVKSSYWYPTLMVGSGGALAAVCYLIFKNGYVPVFSI